MKEYVWNLSDLKSVNKNRLKVFSCFSCGGGSTMGYKLAGYEVIGNCEIDPNMNKVYVENHKPKYNFLMGVQELYKLQDIPSELFDLDILDGSPPCSTFSMSGSREDVWGENKKFKEGQSCQILDDLFFEFIKVAQLLKPKIVIAENVKGMILGNAKGYINLIVKEFENMGYDTQLFLLNSATMGVPQRRERLFFIARRRDLKLSKIRMGFKERLIPYGEFKDKEYKSLNKNTMMYKRWLNRNILDDSVGDTVKRTENGKISNFNYYYVKSNKVPNTLLAGSQLVRFDVPGYISDRDTRIIQTFPLDYKFLGQDVNYICGMSVPPLMMKRISEQVKIQMFDRL